MSRRTGRDRLSRSACGWTIALTVNPLVIAPSLAQGVTPTLQAPPAEKGGVAVPPSAGPQARTEAWRPPGAGTDGTDWVKLKSGEWLRGRIKYIQNREIEFDSLEMDVQTLKLKNVSEVFTGNAMYTQFADRPPVYGNCLLYTSDAADE